MILIPLQQISSIAKTTNEPVDHLSEWSPYGVGRKHNFGVGRTVLNLFFFLRFKMRLRLCENIKMFMIIFLALQLMYWIYPGKSSSTQYKYDVFQCRT